MGWGRGGDWRGRGLGPAWESGGAGGDGSGRRGLRKGAPGRGRARRGRGAGGPPARGLCTLGGTSAELRLPRAGVSCPPPFSPPREHVPPTLPPDSLGGGRAALQGCVWFPGRPRRPCRSPSISPFSPCSRGGLGAAPALLLEAVSPAPHKVTGVGRADAGGRLAWRRRARPAASLFSVRLDFLRRLGWPDFPHFAAPGRED